MNKLLNKLKTLFNRNKPVFLGIVFGIFVSIFLAFFGGMSLISLSIHNALYGEKTEIIVHIAMTHMKNSNYKTAIEGDSLKTFYNLPKTFKGDSIEFLGLKRIQETKLRNTTIGKASNYLLGLCYYNLALEESDPKTNEKYYEKAIDSFVKFSSRNSEFDSRAKENIGDICSELGKEELALEYYQKALKNNNKISKIYLLKKAAQIAKKLDKNELAIEYYQEIKNDFPKSRSAKDIEKYINELSN